MKRLNKFICFLLIWSVFLAPVNNIAAADFSDSEVTVVAESEIDGNMEVQTETTEVENVENDFAEDTQVVPDEEEIQENEQKKSVEVNDFTDDMSAAEDEVTEEVGVSVDTSDVTIYAMDSPYSDVLTIPDNFPTSYQIKIRGKYNRVEYELSQKFSIKVDDNGLITPAYKDDHIFDDTTVKVIVDGKTFPVKVTLASYELYYAQQRMNKFVDENITDSMTDMEKVRTICKWISENFNYDDYTSYVGMMIFGGGNCWGNTAAVNYLCQRAGLVAYTRNGNIDPGAGSMHVNSMVIIDGERWMAECGFEGTAPRYYKLYRFYMDYSGTILDDDTFKITQYEGTDKDVVVPDTLVGRKVSAIGANAFSNAVVDVTSVTLPETVTTLDDKAFYGCKELTSITIPASVTSIGKSVFGSFDHVMTDIKVEKGNTSYVSRSGVLFTADGKELVAFPDGIGGNYTIPDGVEKIAAEAFYSCYKLDGIKLPAGLKMIGDGAFSYAYGLRYIEFPESVEEVGSSILAGVSPARTRFLGKNTQIAEDALEKADSVVVAGPKNSTAEGFAKEKGYKFYNLEKEDSFLLKSDWFKDVTFSYTYNGKEREPGISRSDIDVGEWIMEGYDYTVSYKNNIHAGTATVIVTGKGLFSGTVEKEFTIEPEYLPDISGRYIFKDSGKATFSTEETGKPITPEIRIEGLTEGKDYELKYYNNILPGRAGIEVAGKGDYKQCSWIYFDIVKKTHPDEVPQKMTVKLSRMSYTYNGKSFKPAAEVRVNGKKIGVSDYQLYYKNNKNPGYATVSVKGQGDYKKCSTVVSFKIIPAKPKLLSAKSYTKHTTKLCWKKDTGVSGYQISFGSNKKFTGAKDQKVGAETSCILKKLKSGKVYYIRIRSYKKSGSKLLYSRWSNIKTVKVK